MTRDGCWEAFIDQKRRADALESQLKALEWQPITPENLPKVGDEVACFDSGGSVIYEVSHLHTLFSSQKWRDERGMTHFRPINPPAQEQP
jgi:hypothetical protein